MEVGCRWIAAAVVGGTAAVCCSFGMVDMVAVQAEVAELALVVELGYMA